MHPLLLTLLPGSLQLFALASASIASRSYAETSANAAPSALSRVRVTPQGVPAGLIPGAKRHHGNVPASAAAHMRSSYPSAFSIRALSLYYQAHAG